MASVPMRGPATRRKLKVGEVLRKILFYLLVAFILIYTIFPFYWAIVTSLKKPETLFDTPVNYLPLDFTLDNYRQAFSNPNFLPALRNSTIITLVTVTLALTIGALGAYATGRLKFRGRTFVLYLTLSMTMFPAIAIVGSLYQLIIRFNLYNTIGALILSYLVFTLPFTVWVLTNFFKTLPAELEEAALVDGATPFQTFYKVLLPLAAPGLVTTGLLAFISAWNEFLFALTFTQDYRARTAVVFVGTFAGEREFSLPWGSIMALSVTLTLPLIVLVLFFQRRIIAGLTAGAVKG